MDKYKKAKMRRLQDTEIAYNRRDGERIKGQKTRYT